jgi:hypothetical protein
MNEGGAPRAEMFIRPNGRKSDVSLTAAFGGLVTAFRDLVLWTWFVGISNNQKRITRRLLTVRLQVRVVTWAMNRNPSPVDEFSEWSCIYGSVLTYLVQS